jgi:hypothetical protein
MQSTNEHIGPAIILPPISAPISHFLSFPPSLIHMHFFVYHLMVSFGNKIALGAEVQANISHLILFDFLVSYSSIMNKKSSQSVLAQII